jgi:hypothetical protein
MFLCQRQRISDKVKSLDISKAEETFLEPYKLFAIQNQTEYSFPFFTIHSDHTDATCQAPCATLPLAEARSLAWVVQALAWYSHPGPLAMPVVLSWQRR